MSENLKDLAEQGKTMDWATAQKEGVKNREQFLEIYPSMADWLEQGEKLYGAFLGITSVSFTDERCVFLYKWEKVYFADFYNPANKEESKEKSVVLSYEAMNALMTLYHLFKGEEDTRRFYKALGIAEEEIEEYLKEKEQKQEIK